MGGPEASAWCKQSLTYHSCPIESRSGNVFVDPVRKRTFVWQAAVEEQGELVELLKSRTTNEAWTRLSQRSLLPVMCGNSIAVSPCDHALKHTKSQVCQARNTDITEQQKETLAMLMEASCVECLWTVLAALACPDVDPKILYIDLIMGTVKKGTPNVGNPPFACISFLCRLAWARSNVYRKREMQFDSSC